MNLHSEWTTFLFSTMSTLILPSHWLCAQWVIVHHRHNLDASLHRTQTSVLYPVCRPLSHCKGWCWTEHWDGPACLAYWCPKPRRLDLDTFHLTGMSWLPWMGSGRLHHPNQLGWPTYWIRSSDACKEVYCLESGVSGTWKVVMCKKGISNGLWEPRCARNV